MKKNKIVLKGWLEKTIIILTFILILSLGYDCDNLKFMIISKLVAVVLININYIIMSKYSRLFNC